MRRHPGFGFQRRKGNRAVKTESSDRDSLELMNIGPATKTASKVPDEASDIGTLVAFEGEADPAL